jgi:hypothetical protein
MAILGCGESDASCRELRVEAVEYRSESACLAATEAALMRHGDLPFPTVVAQCRRAGTGPQPLRGSDVALPDAAFAASPRYAQADTARPPRR